MSRISQHTVSSNWHLVSGILSRWAARAAQPAGSAAWTTDTVRSLIGKMLGPTECGKEKARFYSGPSNCHEDTLWGFLKTLTLYPWLTDRMASCKRHPDWSPLNGRLVRRGHRLRVMGGAFYQNSTVFIDSKNRRAFLRYLRPAAMRHLQSCDEKILLYKAYFFWMRN